jgi:ATP-binding cassette subfamily B protein
LLRDPRILIFDEATSSLDSVAEAQIQEAMKEVFRGRTSIVIAHRLSTIRNAGLILVFQEGRICERGRHEELLRREGLYRALYDNQLLVSG